LLSPTSVYTCIPAGKFFCVFKSKAKMAGTNFNITDANVLKEQHTLLIKRAQQDYIASAMFPNTKIIWSGFIDNEFSFIILGFANDRSFTLEMRIKSYPVFVLFATIEIDEAIIFEIKERNSNYLPLTSHFLSHFVEQMKKEKVYKLTAPLWEHNRQQFEFFEQLEFTEVYEQSEHGIVRTYQKVLLPA
jgi:hypothetical protein